MSDFTIAQMSRARKDMESGILNLVRGFERKYGVVVSSLAIEHLYIVGCRTPVSESVRAEIQLGGTIMTLDRAKRLAGVVLSFDPDRDSSSKEHLREGRVLGQLTVLQDHAKGDPYVECFCARCQRSVKVPHRGISSQSECLRCSQLTRWANTTKQWKTNQENPS